MDSKTFTIKYLGNNIYLIQTTGDCSTIKKVMNDYWDDNLYGWLVSEKDKCDFIKLYNEICNISNTSTFKKKKKINKDKIFTDMEFSKYGKGYLLSPIIGKKHPDWGFTGNKSSNYYYGGWWRNDLEGWFFRGSLLKTLISNGASEI